MLSGLGSRVLRLRDLVADGGERALMVGVSAANEGSAAARLVAERVTLEDMRT